jgi:hypothetical protein
VHALDETALLNVVKQHGIDLIPTFAIGIASPDSGLARGLGRVRGR